MKFIKYIGILPVLLFVIAACSDDIDKTIFREDAVVSSELNPIKDAYVLDVNDPDKVVDTFEWGKMDFGYPAAIKYSVEVDLKGNEFKTAQIVTSGTTTKSDIIAKSLNVATLAAMKANELEFTEGLEVEVEFRIKASISEVAAATYSLNIQSSIVTPYYVPEYPEELFMIGQQFGGWDWGSDGVVSMVPVNGNAGMFWAVKYLEEGNGFKWNSIKDWDGSFSELNRTIGVTPADGNASVSESGLYLIFVDLDNSVLAIEPAEVYGIGDAFGGYDSAKYPFIHEGELMSITTNAAGDLRIYATSAYATSLDIEWWKMEFILDGGEIKYRGTGGDQDRVQVNPGQVVTLNFNTESGTIK